VEEALCFGWIDSLVKKLDDDHTVQRFSPRKPQTKFFQAVLIRETEDWAFQRNNKQATVDWRFTTGNARIKLKRLYPSIHN
jgi:hypothetical protein